jgi:hypothetical protein
MMDEFLERQRHVLLQSISEYRLGQLSLDALVKRIEGITAAVDSPTWSRSVYPVILSLEQVNAAIIETQTGLTPSNAVIVNSALDELQTLLQTGCCFFYIETEKTPPPVAGG